MVINNTLLWKCSFFFSDQDPGGLLLLPDKGTSADVDVTEVLTVMRTLLVVMSKEVVVFKNVFFFHIEVIIYIYIISGRSVKATSDNMFQ